MADVKTYSPGEVVAVAFGAIISSWDEITVVLDEDKFSFTSDVSSGEATRVENKSKLGTITLTLPQASADNGVLSAIDALGSLGPVSIFDKSGSSLHVMAKGTIVKSADVGYGKENGSREWVIRGNLDVNVIGGNS